MARPKIDEPKKAYSVMLQPSFMEKIERIAIDLDISNSELMRHLLEYGIGELEILKKEGYPQLIQLNKKFKEEIKKNVGNIK